MTCPIMTESHHCEPVGFTRIIITSPEDGGTCARVSDSSDSRLVLDQEVRAGAHLSQEIARLSQESGTLGLVARKLSHIMH